MMVFAVIDLPEPDSPTMQRISPRFSSKEMSSTAWARSAPDGRRTVRPSTCSSGFWLLILSPPLPRKPGIEGVIQSLANQVERQHRQQDCDPREEAHPPCLPEHRARRTDHVAPGHLVGVAQTQEGQRRLEQAGGGPRERGHDDTSRTRDGTVLR